jgi:MFS family permease
LPASTAALPNLIADDDLRWANSMHALSTNAGLVAGPMVGGWLLALGGIHVVFAVNAVSFAASALVIARVRGRFEKRRAPNDERVSGLRTGYRVIARSRVIATVTAALALAHFTFGLAMVADPALAKDFRAGPFGYAVLYTGWGAVALVGAWIAGRAVDNAQVPYRVIIGLGMVALACAAIAVLPWFWAIVIVGSFGGIGSGALFPLTTGLVQQHSDDAVRARVFGAIDTVDKSLFASGMIAGAPLVSALGAQGSYAVTAALLGVATVIMFGLPAAVRRAERPALVEV